jgi:hypothetical protein
MECRLAGETEVLGENLPQRQMSKLVDKEINTSFFPLNCFFSFFIFLFFYLFWCSILSFVFYILFRLLSL